MCHLRLKAAWISFSSAGFSNLTGSECSQPLKDGAAVSIRHLAAERMTAHLPVSSDKPQHVRKALPSNALSPSVHVQLKCDVCTDAQAVLLNTRA